MRILLVHPGPEFSVHDVFNGWEKALRKLGHQVKVFNLNARLSYNGNAYLRDYPDGWEGTRELPACPACNQPPFKKAMTDKQVKLVSTRQVFEDAFVFWPDVIFFVSGFFFDDDVFHILRARGIKLVMLHTESPYEDDRQLATGEHMDLNLVNDPTRLKEWQAAGNAHYVPHAYDPDIHYPQERLRYTVNTQGDTAQASHQYEADFAFIGTGFKSRRDFFGRLDLPAMHRDGLRVTIGGGGWGDAVDEPENAHILEYLGHHPEMCVDNDETANVYRASKVSLNLYRKEGEDGSDYRGWSMGPREVELAACETFFLRDPRPESDMLFGKILPAFSSPEDAADQIRWWASPGHDSQREQLAREARRQVASRTFDGNARKFMQYLEDAGLMP